MLIRPVPKSREELIRRELLSDKRSSPYLVVFSMFFALVVQQLASWLFDQVKGVSSPKPEQMLAFVPYVLIGLIFFCATYFWLFFSRVLVYFEEDDIGEFLSFVLAATILVIIGTIREYLIYWPGLLAIPTALVTLKLLYLKRRASTIEDSKLRPLITWWAYWMGIVSILLALVGLLTYPWEGSLESPRLIINAFLPLILLGISLYSVFKAASKIQATVEKIVADLIKQQLDSEP